MGALFIASETKGFTGCEQLSATNSMASTIEKKEVAPALAKLLDALKEQGTVEGPTEITIAVVGKERRVFTVELEDLREIQEILEWTIGC